jgi:Fe-S-cluster containining protein
MSTTAQTINPLLTHEAMLPLRLGRDDKLRFRCHKQIRCFNACCQQIDITLTPYDILRLKNRLGLSSEGFLTRHAVPFEIDSHGLPGLKLRSKGDSTVCPFVTEEGCSVYTDRPSACRYYPLGHMLLRPQGSPTTEDHYFLIKEAHCLGHEEDRELTIQAYREEQQVEEYDEANREWLQLILKKRSAGPAIGQPSRTSFQFFFMVSYNLDQFAEFIGSPSFQGTYDLAPEMLGTLAGDELERLRFGNRLLRQVLFAEFSIPLREGAAAARFAARQGRESAAALAAAERWDALTVDD